MRKSSAPSQLRKKENINKHPVHRSTNEILNLLKSSDEHSLQTTSSPVESISTSQKLVHTANSENIIVESVSKDLSNCKTSLGQTNDIYFTVVWGKISSKKHKTWEGDGCLKVTENSVILLNENGVTIGSSRDVNRNSLECGNRLRIGSKELEIIECCESPKIVSKRPLDEIDTVGDENIYNTSSKLPKLARNINIPTALKKKLQRVNTTENALIFPSPNADHQWKNNKQKVQVRNVILDTFLSKILRPHQKDGVIFLYECVMGFRDDSFQGAILADEMGLGKTLQCISLIWTLLKQGPYGKVSCRKCLILVPSSLCANWKKEFVKWLGNERIQTYLVDKSHKIADFKKYPMIPIMIISYEMFVRNFSDIEPMNFDLIICDEGHRLKNSNIKAAQLLQKLPCTRRVLLTGTPIQNDLQEYYTLIDVANPGILGSYERFRKEYEAPIVALQQINYDAEINSDGQEKASLLYQITQKFMLRRTQDIVSQYFPSKWELIICCRLTDLQIKLYNTIIKNYYELGCDSPLNVITMLKKICNHPSILKDKLLDNNLSKNLVDMFDDNISDFTKYSSKFKFIDILLQEIIVKKKERIVLVSYSTKILDILERLCNSLQMKTLRLDGTTAVTQRQTLVDFFNSGGAPIFLLSARAGGLGLNLTGASRLVLMDADWNPSNDLQVVARIWRDGQKKNAVIYRLMSTGTIEEKIYQRQMSKINLSDTIEDPDSCKWTTKFSEAELKDLFSPNFESVSHIHDSMACDCLKNSNIDSIYHTERKTQQSNVNQLQHWEHHSFPYDEQFIKEAGLSNDPGMSFIFSRKSTKHKL